MNQNNKPSIGARALRVLGRFQAALVAIALIVLLLLAAARWLLVPLWLAPALEREVAAGAIRLSELIGAPVAIFYEDAALSAGLDGIYVKVTRPRLEIGTGASKSSFAAESAGLILRTGAQLPEIFVDRMRLAVAQDSEGNFAIADGAAGSGAAADLTGLLASGRMLLPFTLVLRDTDLVFLRPGREDFAVGGLDISAYPDEDTASLVLAARSSELALRADIGLDSSGEPHVRWYYHDPGAGRLLELLSLPAAAESAQMEAWGTYSAGAHAAVVVGKAAGAQTAWSLPATVSLASASFAATAAWSPEQSVLDAKWRIDARGLQAHTEPYILGSVLLLERAAGFGTAHIHEGGWSVDLDDLRIARDGGSAAGALALAGSSAGLSMSLAAHSPQAELAWVAEMLPDDLGDASLAVLREDLTAADARMVTVVVQGDPLDFPWRGNQGGRFRLAIEFAQATLDYLPGYPPVTDALGSLELQGVRMLITVASGKLAGIPMGPAFGAVDDLETIPGTLYVAGSASFGGDELRTLLEALPPVARELARNKSFGFAGAQSTELRLAVPLDTDDPVGVDGSLALSDTALTWEGLPARIDGAQGELAYDAGGFGGIVRGELLGAPVRVSVRVRQGGPPQIEIAGSFDLTQAVAQLGLATVGLPLAGASPYVLRYDGAALDLSTSLQGAMLDLPAPLGKAAAERSSLAVRVGQNPLPLTVAYGSGLLRAVIDEQGADVLVGDQAELPPAAAQRSGLRIAAALATISLDDWLAWSAAGSPAGAVAISATVAAARAQLLDLEHAGLQLDLRADARSTVIRIASDVLEADIEQQGPTLAIDLARLHLPSEDQPSPAADAVITIAPGQPSGRLPAMRVSARDVLLGETRLPAIRLHGQPSGSSWVLNEAQIPFASGTIRLAGSTAMAGAPASSITLAIASHDLEGILDVFGYRDEIDGGSASLEGEIAWEGAISRVHYPSLRGTLALSAESFRMEQLEGESAKLTRLFSPFALLTLGFLELGTKGLDFESARGSVELADGKAHFRDLLLTGEDVSLLVSGSTDLITERHDVRVSATVHNSNQVFTAGAALLNPLLAGTLFLFDNILDKPIIKPMQVGYSITGTWDEPVMENLSEPAPLDEGN